MTDNVRTVAAIPAREGTRAVFWNNGAHQIEAVLFWTIDETGLADGHVLTQQFVVSAEKLTNFCGYLAPDEEFDGKVERPRWETFCNHSGDIE